MKKAEKTQERLGVLSVGEYRRLLNDHESTDDMVIARLRYIEALCRNLIKPELQAYVRENKV